MKSKLLLLCAAVVLFGCGHDKAATATSKDGSPPSLDSLGDLEAMKTKYKSANLTCRLSIDAAGNKPSVTDVAGLDLIFTETYPQILNLKVEQFEIILTAQVRVDDFAILKKQTLQDPVTNTDFQLSDTPVVSINYSTIFTDKTKPGWKTISPGSPTIINENQVSKFAGGQLQCVVETVVNPQYASEWRPALSPFFKCPKENQVITNQGCSGL